MLFAVREHSDASPGPWPSHPRVRLPARWPAAPASLPRLLPGAQVALAGSLLRCVVCLCVLPALSLHSYTPSRGLAEFMYTTLAEQLTLIYSTLWQI